MSANVEVVDGQQAKRARCRALVVSRASGHCVCVKVLDFVALQTVAYKVLFWKGQNCHKKWTPRMAFINVCCIKNVIKKGHHEKIVIKNGLHNVKQL
jgi:hypothetical protein